MKRIKVNEHRLHCVRFMNVSSIRKNLMLKNNCILKTNLNQKSIWAKSNF